MPPTNPHLVGVGINISQARGALARLGYTEAGGGDRTTRLSGSVSWVTIVSSCSLSRVILKEICIMQFYHRSLFQGVEHTTNLWVHCLAR